MTDKRRFAGAAALALLAAGCGNGATSGAVAAAHPSQPSGRVLAAQIQRAVGGAKSAHVRGDSAEGGQGVQLNVSLTRAGGVYGTVAVGTGTLTVLVSQGRTFVKATAASLKLLHLPADSCRRFCGRYLELTPVDAKSLTAGLSWSSLVGGLATPAGLHGLKVTGSASMDGQPVWVVRANDGSTGYVAARGPAYLLRITPPRGKGRADFTRWDSVTVPPPPSGSQVVHPGALRG